MHFFKLTYLCLWIGLASSSRALSSELTLADFLARELPKNSTLRDQNLRRLESQIALEAGQTWWRASVQTGIFRSTQDLQQPQSLRGEQDGLSLGVKAALKSGTTLELLTLQNDGKKQPLTADYLQTYRAGLTQSLFFGAEQGWADLALSHQASARSLEYQATQRKQCIQLIEEFFQVMTSKNIYASTATRKDLAAELVRQLQGSRSLGRVSRLSLLQAQADVLVLESQALAARNEWLRLAQMSHITDPGINLRDPSAELTKMSEQATSTNASFATTKAIQSLDANLAELEARERLIAAQTRPDLNVKFEQAWFEGYQYLQDRRISLNLTWDFDDPDQERELAIANLRKAHVAKTRQLTLEELARANATNAQVIKNLQENQQALAQRLTLLREIEQEFRSRFLRGLIEFQAYTQTRDQMLSLEIEQARNKKDLAVKRLEQLELSGVELPLCEVKK